MGIAKTKKKNKSKGKQSFFTNLSKNNLNDEELQAPSTEIEPTIHFKTHVDNQLTDYARIAPFE